MKKEQTAERYDGAYIKSDGGTYRGKKRFTVSHKSYKTVTVAAPDEISAIVAAANIWGVPWTKVDVYAYASVIKA